MHKRLPLKVAGLIFALVAILHAVRLFYHWEVIINGQVIAMSVSTIGFIVGAILALWMFKSAYSD